MQKYDPKEIDERTNARIMKTAVSPRPIAWISTLGTDGTENLAPFSSYNYVGSTNPVVLFNTPNGPDDELKDTTRNALDSEEFAVNIVTESNLEKMDRTSATLPPDESEFDFADVERADCERISPPRVADAAVTMECTLHDTLEVHDRLMVLGDVQYYHIAEEAMVDGAIDSTQLEMVGRLGGPYYTIATPVEFERQY